MDFAPADRVRAQIVDLLRDRRAPLTSDLCLALGEELALEAPAVSGQRLAEQLVDLLAAALQDGEPEGLAGAVSDLDRLTRGILTTGQLFSAVQLAERTALDDLALDSEVGATSEWWPLVSHLMRSASFRLLTALTDHLAASPARGRVHDPLTTLLVRPVFEVALEQEIHRAYRHQQPLSVILFDLDGLAAINARYGPRVGDRVLERMGILVRRFFRTHDWVARFADDAIVALLPQTSLEDAVTLAERVQGMVETRLAFKDERGDAVRVTLSAAVVGSDVIEPELDARAFLAEAEEAVGRARLGGPRRLERVALVPSSVSLLGAANLLGLAPAAIRRLVREGALPAERRGRYHHIARAAVEKYRVDTLARQRGEAT